MGRSLSQRTGQIPLQRGNQKGRARRGREPGFAAVQRPRKRTAAHAQRGPQSCEWCVCLPEFGAGGRARRRVGPTEAGRGGAGGLARWAARGSGGGGGGGWGRRMLDPRGR